MWFLLLLLQGACVANSAPKMNTSTVVPPVEGVIVDCDTIPTDYNIAPAIISGMCFVFGIMYTFLGGLVYSSSSLVQNQIW